MKSINVNGYDLDETQMSAILDNNEACVVVAGAGSGKTLTILGKIKYLIEENNYNEKEILCISFTNETVNSLKNKLMIMHYDINVMTFHRLALEILKGDNYSIISDNYLEYVTSEYLAWWLIQNKHHKWLLRYLLKSFDKTDKLVLKSEYTSLKATIITFIKLAKANAISLSYIYKKYLRCFGNERILLKLIMDIYLIYEKELNSINAIDFDDMLVTAKEKVKSIYLPYRYIIIDEFQDTSQVRFNLIKEIIKYTNSKLFVVGDDWQSIYRFSGCDLELFVNLNNYMNDVNYHYLRYTYRNSMELIKVSANFVMENKRLLRKKIVSNKHITKPIIILFDYNFEDTIKIIDDTTDILVLARNNSDIKDIPWDNKLTIHRSKGLEANNVILVKSETIPNTKKNDRILRYVISQKDYILYEEERRLFYVALTRTKNKIYIMVNSKKISPFIRELINNYKDFIQIKK